MTLRSGFAQIDITPPIGTAKIGWLRLYLIEAILDPIFSRAAVFESDGQRVGFLTLDTLSVRWTTVSQIRREVERRFGFPGRCLMVAASHNHAGPAVANLGDVYRDEGYIASMVDKCVAAVGRALEGLVPATMGIASGYEFGVAHNRRVSTRDGRVRTHGRFPDPALLCLEGPIDPELAVIAARDGRGRLLGALVNFACHPTHEGNTNNCSAGWPGALARQMQARGCPVPLLLNGAAGDLHHADPTRGGASLEIDQIGERLAEHAMRVIEGATFSDALPLSCGAATVQLPYRTPTEDQVRGTARGAQRFVDPAIYERHMPALLERIRTRGTQPAEVQVLFMGEHALAAMPAEYFSRLGLAIKERAHPRRALVVGFANGMVGYVPHKAAFERGGYETTFALSSRLAPEAGDLLADAAVELIAAGG